ncbi:DUF2326 domain-containing protein [Streptosporangium oxazolinicum]
MKILKIYANKPTFREIHLQDGLNLIVAERADTSSEHDSRNGVGKSTLLEIIHFCLGSSVSNKSVISHLKETDWQFSLELRIDDAVVHVTRGFLTPSQVILRGDIHSLGVIDEAELFPRTEAICTLKRWKDLLGALVFGLDDQVLTESAAPSFRALISYFARSGRDAYIDSFTTSRQIRTWQKQVYNAYLVGLNWHHASKWEMLRENEKLVRTLTAASSKRSQSEMADLENERVRLSSERERLEAQVANFKVVPEYRAVETAARNLTRRMRELANESSILSQMIEKYELQMETESAEDLNKVRQIYADVGLLFPDRLNRELEQVLEFHTTVTRHRREYLSNEIIRLRSQVDQIQLQLSRLDTERSEQMQLLSDGGAVEELGNLQFRLGRTLERLHETDKKLAGLETVAIDEATIASDRQALLSRAVIDRAERRPRWSAVIAKFVEATDHLYEESGALNFGLNENGFTFETKMPRQRSGGVENMAIFAYDLALTQVWSTRENHPAFLIHDSILYEGVDERQIALALQYAMTKGEACGFQYLALINSDNIPRADLAELGLNWRNHVRLELKDDDPAHTLLGYRF